MVAKPLAACTYLSSTVSQLFEPQVQKMPFSRTAAHIFVSPGDAPATITQYVAWMERQFNACQSPRSMYLSIFNSFRVIRCLSQCVSPKIAIFTKFLFPLGMPLGAITLNVVWMEREFDAYKLSCSMYLSIFNSFPVIRTASAKNRRFHVSQPTFLFPLALETALQLSRNILHGWKDNSMLAKRLAAKYLSVFNSFRVIRCLIQCISPKIAIFTKFLFPLGTLLGQSR